MVMRENRAGSAAVRTPSIVTAMRATGMPASWAYISISATPQDEMLARNASLFVRASGWGRDDESRTRRWPRTTLCARPRTPPLDDRIVSIFASLTKGPRAAISWPPDPAAAPAPAAPRWRRRAGGGYRDRLT